MFSKSANFIKEKDCGLVPYQMNQRNSKDKIQYLMLDWKGKKDGIKDISGSINKNVI